MLPTDQHTRTLSVDAKLFFLTWIWKDSRKIVYASPSARQNRGLTWDFKPYMYISSPIFRQTKIIFKLAHYHWKYFPIFNFVQNIKKIWKFWKNKKLWEIGNFGLFWYIFGPTRIFLKNLLCQLLEITIPQLHMKVQKNLMSQSWENWEDG